MSDKFFHSVYLDADLCKGCINCIKRCPTEAIRVRNGKARITSSFCIDCGECVRVCANHAKKVSIDSLDILDQYEYTVTRSGRIRSDGDATDCYASHDPL